MSRDANGRFLKGCRPVGRAKGTPDKATGEIKALAFEAAPKAIKKLAFLVDHGENQNVQVAACKELLDRAIGKAVQPHAGESGVGPIIVQVITGVPRADDFDISSPRIISRDESLTTGVF